MTYVTVVTTCLGCNEQRTFYLPAAQHDLWTSGAHLQDVFPDWEPEDREQLISGTCPSCWEEMWAEEEEEGLYDDEVNEIFFGDLDPFSDFPEYESDYYVDRDCD